MTKAAAWWGMGSRIAPPRFALFVVAFAGTGAVLALTAHLGRGRTIMAAFDVAAIAFLLAVATLFRRGDAEHMRRAAKANDANRGLLLGITGATMLAILGAVAGELKGKNDAATIALVIATLVLAWLFSNMVYALHYAHLYYVDGGGDGASGGDAGGLGFPDCDEPDYWDFVYFSFTLGMTFQTSDVEIRTRRLRRIAIGQCLAAFVFNLGVVAFTINVLGGGS